MAAGPRERACVAPIVAEDGGKLLGFAPKGP